MEADKFKGQCIDMIDKSFVFIAGHHRSGTSLLHRIIRDHPQIGGFKGTGVPEDEGQHLQSIYMPAYVFGGPGKYIFDERSYMNEFHQLATDNTAKAIFEQWEKFYDAGCLHYVEKSPPNLIRTRFLQKIFPNSKFIVILRHPIAVSYATQKWSGTSIVSLLDHTLRGYEIFTRDLAFLSNAYVLRYEDFVLNPCAAINEIYRFLSVDKACFAQTVHDGVNNKYFSMWADQREAILSSMSSHELEHFEQRSRVYGYSILDCDKYAYSYIYGTHIKISARIRSGV